jgi:hypothetical protein
MVDESNLVSLVGALIGATGGSIGGNFFTDWLSRRAEKHKLSKFITDKYLIQLQYLLESLYFRFYNMKERGGSKYMKRIKGDEEYYILSSLYALGSVLAYHRLLLFEGIYSQIESFTPKVGSELLNKLDEFGILLDNIKVSLPDSNKKTKFFRYDRVLLGDVLTNEEGNIKRNYSYIRFRERYEKEEFIRKYLQPAREFVEALQYSADLSTLMKRIHEVLRNLEPLTKVPVRINQKSD